MTVDRTYLGSEEVAAVSVRWWKRHGRVDLGIGIGTIGFVPAQDAVSAVTLLAPTPSVTLAWRYRLDGETALYADATGAGRAAGRPPGMVNAKLGVEWQPAKSRFGFENRSLGLQLQSGYRLSLRVRGGGLGIYVRGKF